MRHVRVIRSAAGRDADEWAAAVAAPDWLKGSLLLKEEGRAFVRRARILGRDVVVKQWPLDRPKRRIQALFGATPAYRHWRGAARLGAIGIRTAPVHIIVRGRTERGLVELLVMDHLGGKTILEHIARADLPVRQQHAVARELGRQARQIAVAGLFNRDHKPSNLILEQIEPPEIAAIDCIAISRCGPNVLPKLARMLASQSIEATGCGIHLRRTLLLSACRAAADRGTGAPGERRQALRALLALIAEHIRRHGDPTPRVNPLAGAGAGAREPSV